MARYRQDRALRTDTRRPPETVTSGEEETGVPPPHGFIVTGDGQRHQAENTGELPAWVLDPAGPIRAARASVTPPITVEPKPCPYRPCWMSAPPSGPCLHPDGPLAV